MFLLVPAYPGSSLAINVTYALYKHADAQTDQLATLTRSRRDENKHSKKTKQLFKNLKSQSR